jgi:glycosyltransferase involved in cell wall biosynthesis
MYQYLPALAAAGISVTAAPLLAGEDLGRRQTTGGYPLGRLWAAISGRARAVATRRRYDVLWIEYELMPFLPALVEHLCLRGGPPRVVEYDDAVFHRYDRHRSALVRGLLGRKIDRLMAGAAVVVAGNAYLADRARAAGARDVAIIPSVVDLDRYPVIPPAAGGPPVIGWIGSPSTAVALDAIAPALARVCAGGRARVVLVGVTPGLRAWPFPCEERPWIDGREAAEIGTFDIGVMPLADDPWSRGKCGFKLVQYLACGRPAVASPVGVNPAIAIDGTTGLLATTEDEWVRALDRLIDDPALRARLGAAGRAHVEAHYALHRTAPLVADVLRRAAGGAASCAA